MLRREMCSLLANGYTHYEHVVLRKTKEEGKRYKKMLKGERGIFAKIKKLLNIPLPSKR
jgi:hypothetical protein